MTEPAHPARDRITVVSKARRRCRGVVALRDCQSGREFPFQRQREIISIGGSTHCDITLRDPYASSRHCTVERNRGRWVIRDQGSKNGTLLNGARIESAELSPGSQLLIGQTQLLAVGLPAPCGQAPLVGEAPLFLEAIALAKQAARGDCSVLLLGETGTGKELFARLIHEESRLAGNPYVPVNCGAIPRELLASELFGHVQGAFTGAHSDRDGYFLQADGGTLFLDEIGELPMEQQPHLLRALETRMIRRVGARLEQMVHVRVVAATNRYDVGTSQGRLRTDLYHRLATVVIELPALRDRAQDIPLLVRSFLEGHEERYGPREISETTLAELQHHDWPGNVRELRNSVERAVACTRRQIGIQDLLPIRGRPAQGSAAAHAYPLWPAAPCDSQMAHELRSSYQRWGSIRKAAEALGMPKSTFADQCQRLGIRTKGR